MSGDLTQAEAKTKACPFSRTFGASQQLADGPGPHCIASQCMAWRWRGSSAVIDRGGYCGIAGDNP